MDSFVLVNQRRMIKSGSKKLRSTYTTCIWNSELSFDLLKVITLVSNSTLEEAGKYCKAKDAEIKTEWSSDEFIGFQNLYWIILNEKFWYSTVAFTCSKFTRHKSILLRDLLQIPFLSLLDWRIPSWPERSQVWKWIHFSFLWRVLWW